MANPNDNIRRLYQNGLKHFSLPDFDTFQQDMKDEEKRKRFYTNMQGAYSLPDFETFSQDIGAVAPPQSQQQPTPQQTTSTVKPITDNTAASAAVQPMVSSDSVTSASQPEQPAGWQPTMHQRMAFDMQMRQGQEQLQRQLDEGQQRLAGIQKGNRPGAFMGEREFNPQSGQMETAYYTQQGDRVGSRLQQSQKNAEYHTWWENNTDAGRQSKEQRLQREFNNRLARLWQRHDPTEGENAAEQAWSAAEARQSVAANVAADRTYSNYSSNYPMGGPESRIVAHSDYSRETAAAKMSNFDLDRLMDDSWNNLGEDGQQALIDDCHQILRYRYPGADELVLYKQAQELARQQSDLRLYNLAVEKNRPKSELDYLLRKIGDMNVIRSLSKAAAVSKAGTTGDMAAYEAANEQYRQDGHKILDVAGMVAGFALDPTTWLSAGVGGAAAKGAMWTGGRYLAGRGATAAATKAATRQFASTMTGRVVGGVVGGAANFGTFEGLKEVENQMVHGGHITGQDETGRYINEGYSASAVAGQVGHGLLMGAAIGWLGPVTGNVSDKLVRGGGKLFGKEMAGISNAYGKAATRAGLYAGATTLEGTIFSVPEWIDGNRDAMDVWTDNMAMMAGFKAKHVLKSVGGVLGDLKASFDSPTNGRKNRLDFESRLRMRMDAPSDGGLSLTKDERAELERYGYNDLRDLVESAERTGDASRGELITQDAPQIVSRLTDMVTDTRISEAARAKMYYYATGRKLPESTIMRGEMVEDGKGGFIVESQGANGVITSRTFSSRKAADLELERINRQVELNSIELGERYQPIVDFESRMMEASRRVAAKHGWNPVDVYRTCEDVLDSYVRSNHKELSDVQKNIYSKILAELDKIEVSDLATEKRTSINAKYDVDIDKAIRKDRDRRTDAEQRAIDEYITELMPHRNSWNVAFENAGQRLLTTDEPPRKIENVDFQEIDKKGQTIGPLFDSSNEAADRDPHQPSGEQKPIGRAVMKFEDRPVEVLSGRIVLSDDGTILDNAACDKSIVIRDLATGKVEMVAPEAILSYKEYPTEPIVDRPVDNSAVKTTAEEAPVTEQPKYGAGQITIRNSDGTTSRGWLTGEIDEDGKFEYYVEGDLQHLHYASEHELDNIVEDFKPDAPKEPETPAENMSGNNGAENIPTDGNNGVENIPTNPKEYEEGYTLGMQDVQNFSDEQLNAQINKLETEAERLTDFGKGLLSAYQFEQQRRTAESPQQTPQSTEVQPTTESVPKTPETVPNPTENAVAGIETVPETVPTVENAQEQTPLQLIPRNETGEPMFEQAETPELGWDALVEFAEGDAATAKEIADTMAEEKRKAFEKAQKLKPKGKTPTEILASKKANAAELTKTQAEYDQWQRMAGVEQARQRVIRSQQEAEATRLAAERVEAEKAERTAREEAERVEREALEGIPEWHMDTPDNARKRGTRRFNGQMFTRQEPVQGVIGNEVEVKFSQKDLPKGRVAVIEASQLQPSHMQGRRNPMFFIDEAQPKNRAEAVSTFAAQQMAEGIRPQEITGSATAYTGAPTVNTRGEVIQGNNRSDALRYLWENTLPEQQQIYKQYILDNAEQFGIDPDAVNAIQQPVLVNMLDVDDAEAIRLGQMTAQDTESGGVERIKPKNVAQKLGEDMRSFANMLLRSGDEDASFGQLVDRNGTDVLKWMNQAGAISNTQYQSAFDSKGNITPEAKNDLQKVLYQAVFKGGSQQLEEMFDQLPAKAQRAILGTAFRDMDSPLAGKMLPEIQASIVAFNQLMHDTTFAEAKNLEQALRAVNGFKRTILLDDRFEQYMPADNFSNFALHLAAMYKASDMSQTTIASYFNQMYDLAQGKKAATLFEEADTTEYPLAEVIKQVLGFEYKPAKNGNWNDRIRGASLGIGDKHGQERQYGDGELSASGEQTPGRTESSERGGGTSGDSRGSGNASVNRGKNNDGTNGELGEEVIPSVGPFGEIYTQFRGKPQEAVTFLLAKRSGEAIGALYHKDIGEIDLVWGEEGTGHSDGFGLSKLAKFHPEVLFNLQNILNDMVITKRSANRVQLESDKYQAAVRLTWDNKKKTWLLTMFEKKNSALDNTTDTDKTLEGNGNDTATPKSTVISSEKRVSASSSDIETEPKGKRNGTATPQNELSSDDKVNTLPSDKQISEDKSSQSSQQLVDDKRASSVQSAVEAASAEVNTTPTPAQAEAGNYKKGHVTIGEFDITIENPAGSTRKGVDANGKEWSTTMANAYGYIKGTEGVDGDHIDVFLHENMNNWDGRKAFVVDQTNSDGSFDEHKVMLGFNDKDEAMSAYLANYDGTWAQTHPGLRISEVSIDDFNKWVQSSHRKTKPFADYSTVSKKTDNEPTTVKGDGYSIAPKPYTNKQGKTLDTYLVTFDRDFSKEEMSALRAKAKGMKGWYDRETRGWMLRSAEEAKTFAEEVIGKSAEQIEDEAPLSMADMDKQSPVKKVNLEGVARDLHTKGETKLSDHAEPIEQSKPKKHRKWISDEDASEFDDLRNNLRSHLGADADQDLVQEDVPSYGTPQHKQMDAEVLRMGTRMSYLMMKGGLRKFSDYAEAMVEEVGDAIRPHLKSLYAAAQNMEDVMQLGWDEEMDDRKTVKAFDVYNFDKPGAKDIIETAKHVVDETESQKQTQEIIDLLKGKRNEQRKKEADKTSADTEAVVSKAETTTDEVESKLETATTEQDAERLSRGLDKEIEEVNKQLALLGYYEADPVEKDFNEAYGYMRNAERKATQDAHRLATQLANDLGITIDTKDNVRKAKYGFGSKIARSNVAPAGGEVYITLPLTDQHRLSMTFHLEPNARWLANGRANRPADDLVYTGGSFYIEGPGNLGSNRQIKDDATYDELLAEVRSVTRHYLPDEQVHPATPLTPLPGEDLVQLAKRVAKDRQSTKAPAVEPQTKMGDLFGGLFDNIENDNTEAESITAKPNTNETTDVQPRPEETGRGRQQPRPDEQMGKGAEHEDERTDGRRVAQRSGEHTLSDTERSGGISGSHQSERSVSQPKNTRNNHAERGVDYAPKGERARIEANIAAIELAKRLLESGATATPQEMSILRKYSGWGGLGAAFNEGKSWEVNPINKRLREVLTQEEYDAAVMSRNSAYYTPAPVIDAMWDIAKALGFKGGNILEGSAGIGNIIGLMPTNISERSNIHAVEIDNMTGGILSLLYPDAKVDVQGFEKTRIGNCTVDLAITNVPFITGLHVMDESGDIDLSKKFRDIHDFCIAKNVRKLREGGIGIFITSSGTLDKSQKLRNWLVGDKEGNADVVGVFRMNNQTFGGTAATSDIIVVRKRVNGQRSAHAIDVSTVSPARTAAYTNDRGKARDLPMLINRYFIEHPEAMGGEMFFGFEQGDTYRPTSMGLFPTRTADQTKRMAAWVQHLAGMDWRAETVSHTTEQTSQINEALGDGVKEGSMITDSEGNICIARMGRAVPLNINKNKINGRTKEQCFKDYAEIKDALAEVLKYQTEHEDNAGLQHLLDRLNRAYDTFVQRYGNLNKNNNLAWLRNDVDFSSIVALETYSEKGNKDGSKTKIYGKTDIFSRRVVEKESEPAPKNIKDGIIASLYKFGRIDPEYLGIQLGKSQAEIKQEIIESGLGFEDPMTGQMEVSYEYLSGNVREKLRQAREANETSGGAYEANIKALEAVVPMNIPAHLIEFALGSSWVEPKLYEKFIKERTELDVKLTNADGTWHMDEPWNTDTPKNHEMGIRSEKLGILIPGHKLIGAALTNKTITVSRTYKDSDGSHTETDYAATTACATKVDEIRQDFKDWAREQMQADPALSVRMEETYNEKFNNSVPKTIPDEFVPEHFGGAATMIGGKPFQLRPHQAKAVIRATTQPVLLAHEVGTGKTYTLITTAMEMRRLGTARKPMIVVQNATVGQFVASAKALYPNAKVLTLEDVDRNAEGRRAFYAKIKFNDWDMIVVPQSVFERIPDSVERQTQFIQDKIEEKMLVLEQMKDADPDGRSQIVRAAEREIARLEDEISQLANGGSSGKKKEKDAKKAAITRQNAEVKARELLDRATDDVDDFDSMGIDAILVDEAHEYKHLGFATAMQRGVKGIDPSPSKKSQGVFLKTQAVLERTGGKNVVFATGTPISNTAAEIWTFMRYLMPADVMKDYGIYYFDDFVRNFGNLQQMLEFKTNGKYDEVNRFAGYVNLPELVRIWSTVADTVLTRDAGGVSDKIPQIEGGKAQDILLPQTRALRSIMKYVKGQLDAYDKMSGKQKKENSHIPLVMYGIAKAAAVDARLVQRDADDDPKSKTNEAVRQTLRTLEETKEYKGTVAIFADNYQRKNKETEKVEFNIYEDIKKKLIAAGVPEEQVVVMKPGMTVNKKLEIFSRVNAGEVRVVMGSTFTLGTGVNIQERLHTLIHLDAPNRPMDYTQRNGRILRQGNLHNTWGLPVRVLRFGVEDSLDVTAYQRLKTKGAIADSIMNGKQLMANSMENRSLEEDQDLFGDITAQLSGSEYAMLKNQIEKEVRKLTAKQKAWAADQTYIHNRKRQIAGQNKEAEKRISDNKVYLEKVEAATISDIRVGKQTYPTVEAMEDFFTAQNKKKAEMQEQVRTSGYSSRPATSDIIISVGGFDFRIHTEISRETKQGQQGDLFYSAPAKMTYSCPELGIDAMPVKGNHIKNAVTEITERVMTGMDFRERIGYAERSIERNNAELQSMSARDGVPFQFTDELAKAQEKLDEYEVLMKKEMEAKEAKYADMDKEVEAASGIELTEEDSENAASEPVGYYGNNAPKLTFEERQRRAVEERGTVIPGLSDTAVKVVEVPRHDFSGTGRQAIEKARNWAIDNLIGRHIAKQRMGDEFSYQVDIDAIDKFLSSSSTTRSENLGVHLAVLKKLQEVINESIDAEQHADYKKGETGKRTVESEIGDNGLLIHRLYGCVRIEGVPYRVKTTLKETSKDLSRPYNYQVTELELLKSGSTASDALSNSNWITGAKLLNGVEKSYDKGVKLLNASKNNANFASRYETKDGKTVNYTSENPEAYGGLFDFDFRRDEAISRNDGGGENRGLQAIDMRSGATDLQRQGDNGLYGATGLRGGLDTDNGEFSLIERVFTENGSFNFTSGEKIGSADDVAFIFSALEDAAKEHSFIVLVKDGKPTVVELSMGTFTQTMVDLPTASLAYNRIRPDQVYFVHNHPSGNLICSPQDVQMLQKIGGMSDVPVFGVIINLKTGKYGTFDTNNNSGVGQKRIPGKENALTVHTLDKQIFAPDYDPMTQPLVRSAQDVASFLNSHRMGDRAKVSFLILSRAGRIVGNIHTPFTEISSNPKEVARYISERIIQFGGESAILYGDFAMTGSSGKEYKRLKNLLMQVGGNTLLDVVHVEGNHTISANDEGLLYEPGSEYGAQFEIPQNNVAEVGARFDSDLERYERGEVPAGYRFELGMPSAELQSAGFPELPITMRASLLARKAGEEKHPFDPSGLRGLVEAMQTPIAIFEYTKSNMRNVIVDLIRNGKHFLVGVTLNYKAGDIEVNSVSGLFPKENHEWIKWIQDGKAIRIGQKGKVQEIIDSLRTNPAESERIGLNLDDVAKIVNFFENPVIEAKKGPSADLRFREVEDDAVLTEFTEGKTVTAYRTMQVIDGKLYSPMATKVGGKATPEIKLGVPEQSEEHPEIIKGTRTGRDGIEQGYVVIDKGQGKGILTVAYNPYIHSSRSVLNDQFTSAHIRPNLVTVEVEVPESELTSGYRAHMAKNAVGEISWHSGSVSGQLAELGKPRRVILTRYDRPVRIVPFREVAEMIAEQLDGTDIAIPYNVVQPQLRTELERLGVAISEEATGSVGEESDFGKAEYVTDQEIARINAHQQEMAQTSPEAKSGHAVRLSKKFNTPIRIINDTNELTSDNAERQARMRRSKGFYDPRTGEVVVVLPNNASVDDVAETVFHEVVAHKGLRELIGEENYDTFCDEVYDHLKEDLKQQVDEDTTHRFMKEPGKGYEHHRRVAVDELFGRMSEKGFEDFTKAERGIWAKLKAKVLEAINRFLGALKLPKWVKLGDNELRYMLWRSHERLRTKSDYVDMARDAAKREELGLTRNDGIRYSTTELKELNVRDSNKRFNEQLWRWEAGTMGNNEFIDVGRPMGVIQHFMPNETMILRQKVLSKSKKKHGLTADNMMGLPGALAHPIFVFKSTPKTVSILTELTSSNGKNLFVAIEVGVSKQLGHRILEVNDILTIHGREAENILLPIAENNSLVWTDKEKGIKWLSSAKSNSQAIAIQTLEDAAKVIKNFENPAIESEESFDYRFRDSETNDIWKDRSVGLDERITNAAIRLANNQSGDLTLRNDAMQAIGGNLTSLRKAMAAQKRFDQATVKRVADLARILMQNGYLSGMTSVEMQRLISAVKNSVGHKEVNESVQKIMDIMVNNQLRNGEETLRQILAVRGSKVDARGVEVQGVLDVDGQRTMEVVKKAMSLSEDDITDRIAEALNRMSDPGNTIADQATIEYAGLNMALNYVQNIANSKAEEKTLRDGLKTAKEEKDAGRMSADAYKEYVGTTEDAIRKNKIERAEAYFNLVGRLSDSLRGSIENAKAFREAEKARVNEVHHNANSDMEGRPTNEHHKDDWKDTFVNNGFVQFLFAPLGTFDQIMRVFGSKSANGEGYLWNRFMRGWVDCRNKELQGVKEKFAQLDEKAAELFGKGKTWGSIIRMEGKLPKATVSFWDGGEMRDHELTQGNLLYICMVDKMTDGRMKLRRMGITENDITNIENFLDPRFKALGDWLQDEFLVATRNEYNETHKRMFGASMAAIENYFPLKILANARIDKEEDVNQQNVPEGITTKTGSIIKRRVNNLALDITGADALSVILDHITQMEHWSAYAEWNRDLNTLRTYKRFRNQVINMTTVYGGGRKLWENFNDLCLMAAGEYRPPISRLNKNAVNLAKGVTAAKVSFRIYTALKQFLSAPAYAPEVSVSAIAKSIANPYGDFKWCLENMPIFRERWHSRISGDPRLLKSDMDWKMWRSRVMEISSRIGMTPNAFVDAVTVSIGARAMYETRLKQYLKEGYPTEAAETRAMQDATILFNQTQQSSESPFLSTMQVDKDWLSTLFTVFRNASMSYTRQEFDAIRNLKRNLTPGQRAKSIEFITKQILRDWNIDPDNATDAERGKAEDAANKRFHKQIKKDVIRIATFGFILEALWNLGPYLPYIIFGNNNDEKDKMWDDAITHAFFGSIEGLTGGDVMSSFGNMSVNGEWNRNQFSKDMPLTSDINDIWDKFAGKKNAEAINDIINLMVQMGAGMNPQSLTDAAVAIMDACGDDPALSHEAAIFVMRVLQVPQSQLDKLYFDEIGLSGEEASKLTPEQLAQRYAEYKVKRGTPLAPWSWDDEERLDKYEESAKDKMKERLDSQGDAAVKEAYTDFEARYKAVSEKAKEAKALMKTDYAVAAQAYAALQRDPDFLIYQRFDRLNDQLSRLSKMWLTAKSPEEARLVASTIPAYRAGMVKVLQAETVDTQQSAMSELTELMNEFYSKYQAMQPQPIQSNR